MEMFPMHIHIPYLLVYNMHPYFWIGKLKIKYLCISRFETNKIYIVKKNVVWDD
jgi:hypothetical protein